MTTTDHKYHGKLMGYASENGPERYLSMQATVNQALCRDDDPKASFRMFLAANYCMQEVSQGICPGI